MCDKFVEKEANADYFKPTMLQEEDGGMLPASIFVVVIIIIIHPFEILRLSFLQGKVFFKHVCS